MNLKTFYIFFIAVFLLTLAFTFYYNSQIVGLNQDYQQLELESSQLAQTNQNLENQLSQKLSLKSIKIGASDTDLAPINNVLDF